MNTLVIVSAVLGILNFANGSPERYVTVYTPKGVPEIIDMQAPIPSVFVSASDISVHLYTVDNYDEPENLSLSAESIMSANFFNSGRKSVFIVHGWQNDVSSDVNTYTRKAFLDVSDVNVFVIDWSTFTYNAYPSAFASIPEVGALVGGVILELQNSLGLDSSMFLLVGHSLGAHVAGCAGAAAESNIDIIVGLDPAGPLFFNSITDNRLDPTDAKFVHVIHTSAGTLGYNDNLGTVDFRPNGGSSQPGCGLDLVKTCAHGRSYHYFAESVRDGGFTAWSCSSYSDYSNGNCNSNKQSHMGGLEIDTSVEGEYFLDTNSESPYSMS